jgi:hypothetical protein
MTIVRVNKDKKPARYSLLNETTHAVQRLKRFAGSQLPEDVLDHLNCVQFTSSTGGKQVYFPSPLKETEVGAALKAVEASIAAAIADLKYGQRQRKIMVDLEGTTRFLFSTYTSTVGGMSKSNPNVKSKLKSM